MTELPPLAERTIGDYLDRLGSSHPDPGGGSVAGLVGALGAGLGQMVISLTRNAPDLEPVRSELQEAIGSLLAASADDERAYAGFVAASKLPKSTPEEKASRKAAMQSALITSAEVPLELAQTAFRVLELLEPVVTHGTSHALSDVEIGVNLAEAAILASLSNVGVNLPWIDNKPLAEQFGERATTLETESRTKAERLRAMLTDRRGS
ncbi:MAG TPA: cyclodeaminase/cyclohydrolase family protein [Thermomicrobiales bacterium]|nr:cyclodeaminase/cyclohydrolase family protein [Thermomicrobiales bacterium]